MLRDKPTLTGWDSDGNEVEIRCTWGVCHRCHGEGRHTNPSIDGNGITGEEMEELGSQFREDYIKGVYDVTCYECKGKRVVAIPLPYDLLTDSEKEAIDGLDEEGRERDFEDRMSRYGGQW